MVRKKRDAEATKAMILTVAEKIFAEKGFVGTTLRDISQASGVSSALLVFHFKDKPGVYRAVKAAIVGRYIAEGCRSSPDDDSFPAFVEHVLSSMFRFYRDNPTMMRLANWGRLEGDSGPWPGEDEWHHVYYDRIRLAQERGEIRDDMTPLNIAIMICGIVHIWWEYHEHFLGDMNAGDDKEAVDDFYFRQCLSFVKRGLSGHVAV